MSDKPVPLIKKFFFMYFGIYYGKYVKILLQICKTQLQQHFDSEDVVKQGRYNVNTFIAKRL